MDDHFAELGLPRAAACDEEIVRERFQERSRAVHPDGGQEPDGEAFERLNQAQAVVGVASRRLKHLLELEFGEGATGKGGAIEEALMRLFGVVGDAVGKADGLISKRRAARTALAKALLEGEVVPVQGALMEAGGTVREAIGARVERLGEVDESLAGGRRDEALALGSELYRELAFLEKWQGQVQGKFAELF